MQNKLVHVALRTTLLYAIVAGLWILVSDKILVALVTDPNIIGKLAIYKGWAFVIVTALLLYFTLRSQLSLWEQESEARKQAEDKMLESESNLSSIINSAMDAIVTVDENHKIVLFNEAAEKMFQYSADEMMGKHFDLLVPERFRSPHTFHMRIFAESGFNKRSIKEQTTIYGLRADGVEIPLEASVSMTMVGERKLFTIIHRDITERLKAEKAVQEKLELHSRLSQIAAASPGLICSFRLRPDGSASFPYTSDAIEDIYGVKSEDVVDDASPIFNIFNSDDAIHVRETIAESARTMTLWHDEFRINHPQKGERWVEGHSMPVKEADGSVLWHGLIQDITVRKHLEEELGRSKSFLNNILENAPVSIFIKDVEDDFRMTYWNHASEEMFGIEKDRIIGFTDYDLFPKEHADFYRLSDKSVIESGQLLDIPEEEGTSKTRGKIYLKTKKVPIFNDKGKATHLLGITDDITERKIAEAELSKREHMLSAINNASPNLIILWDVAKGTISYVNNRVHQILGCTSEQMCAMTYEQLCNSVHPDDLSSIKSFTDELLKAKDNEVLRHEYRYKSTNGEWLVLSSQDIVFERNPNGKVTKVLSVVDDITDRKKAEEAVRDLQIRLQIALESGGMGTWVWDIKNNYLWWGDSSLKLFGLTREDVADGTPENFTAAIHPDDRQHIQKLLDNTVGDTCYDEYRIVRPDGTIIWIADKGRIERDNEGKPLRMTGACVDITERKRMEEDLRKSEERYRALASSADMVWTADAKGHIENPTSDRHKLECLSDEESKEYWRLVIVHPEERRDTIEKWKKAVEAKEVYENENRILMPAGSYRNYYIRAVPVFNEDGSVREWIGMNIDITERKRTQEALHKEQERFAQVAASAPGVVYSFQLKPDGSISMPYASQAITDFFAVTPDEVAENAMPILERLPTFEAERLFTSINESASTMTPWHDAIHWIHPTKGEIWIEGNSVPTKEADGSILWHGFLLDVTERKKAERNLRENEERYRSLVTATSQVVWMADTEGNITNINNIESIFGKDYKEKDWDWVAAVHSDDRARVTQQWRESFESQTKFEFEYRQIDASGNYRYWITRGVPVLDEEGKVREWIGTASDITERKLAEEEVQRFISLSPTVVYALKVEGEQFRHTWTSENLSALTGYQTDETTEPGWWSSNIHPEDRERVFAAHPVPYEIENQIIEFRFRKKDGSYFWVRDEKRLLRDALGKPTEIIGAWSDITERVLLEEKFRQAQKMEAIGQLAGGVAHDFNNLLTVISGYSEILLATMKPDDKKRKYVSDIHHAGARAASLTRQLLAFSRKQVLEPQILNLNDVIKNTEKMLRRLIGEDIILTTLLDASISNIKVDPGQIEQVIMNLAVNARDAMPKGGRLTIETSNVFLDKNYWEYDFEFKQGNYVLLTVTDTGCGMTQEVKERIFEPFFTTKEQGKGTGLGMAMVFGIIKQSDGHISVYSEVGIGSTFKLYFPAIEENSIAQESGEDDQYATHGNETILLVEDETAVRDMAKITLESYGYKVLSADSGHKAIAVVESYMETIHLVVTDVVMPAMSGRELTENLRNRYKNLKILFMSGYTDDAVVRHGIIEKEHAFLQKPFSPIALVKKVRELLDDNHKN